MDAVQPDMKLLEQFVVSDLQDVFRIDALESSHPISIPVKHPDEIQEIFDRISYGKGAAIIRMMDNFLTTSTFRQVRTHKSVCYFVKVVILFTDNCMTLLFATLGLNKLPDQA